MKLITQSVILIIFLASGCAPAKLAPLPGEPVAHFPNMKVGDAYTLVVSGMDEERWEVVAVQSTGEFVLREKSSDGKIRKEMRVDSAYRIAGDKKSALNELKVDFPIFPEKRWSCTVAGEDGHGRPTDYTYDYRVSATDTIQTPTGPLTVFKIKYTRSDMLSGGVGGGMRIGEIGYSPEAKMIVYNDFETRSHRVVAYSVTDDAGKRSTKGALPEQWQVSRAAPLAAAAPAKPSVSPSSTEAVRMAEEKVSAALKEQQEKEALLKARAQRLAEKEAALKAEANRLAEEKLAADTKRLEEREAALKAEAERIESEKRAAAAKAKKDKEDAAKALAAAKARAEAENIEANIPVSPRPNSDAIAVVIGNRDYRNARKVAFAVNDAELVKKYLVNTLGYKEGNVFTLSNASKAEFELYFGNEKSHRGKLFNAVKDGRSDVFIYYSGHGAPGLKDRRGYFVPVEADPQYLELSGYPLDVLYENLAKLPARSTTVVLDACFSGSTIYENISPLVLEVQDPVIKAKNMVVLASAGGTQVSSWYHEKSHSMFTYFLLKSLKDKTADVNRDGHLTYDEVYSYVADKSEGVPYYARRINGIEQNPTISGQYQGRIFLAY